MRTLSVCLDYQTDSLTGVINLSDLVLGDGIADHHLIELRAVNQADAAMRTTVRDLTGFENLSGLVLGDEGADRRLIELRGGMRYHFYHYNVPRRRPGGFI